MKFPEIVRKARESAVYWHDTYVVFEYRRRFNFFRQRYNWLTEQDFLERAANSKLPLIRLITIMPSGVIAQ